MNSLESESNVCGKMCLNEANQVCEERVCTYSSLKMLCLKIGLEFCCLCRQPSFRGVFTQKWNWLWMKKGGFFCYLSQWNKPQPALKKWTIFPIKAFHSILTLSLTEVVPLTCTLPISKSNSHGSFFDYITNCFFFITFIKQMPA